MDLPDGMEPGELAHLDQVCAHARDLLDRHPAFGGRPTHLDLPDDPFD